MTSPEQRERIARDVVLHGGIVIERTVDPDGHTTEVKLVDQDKFPVRSARMREDGAVEVEFEVPTDHPVNEAARQGTLEGISIGPQGDSAPVVRPLDGRTRVIDGAEIRERQAENVPLPGRIDLSKVLALPERDDDGAPPGMRLVPLTREERRARDRRARRGRR